MLLYGYSRLGFIIILYFVPVEKPGKMAIALIEL